MENRKKSKSLTKIIEEGINNKYFKHGSGFYKILEAEMGKTGHLYVTAELYSYDGRYKGVFVLPPLTDNFHLVEEQDLPWIKSQNLELPFN